MNVPERSMLSSYASGEILSARQKADSGRPKGDVIGKRSFPKRGTKCQEEKKDKGRNQNHVIRSMWTVTYWWRKRKRIFCMLRESEISSKQQLILTDQPVVRTTIGNILWENAIYCKIMDRWVKKLKLEMKSLFKNWWEILVHGVTDFLVKWNDFLVSLNRCKCCSSIFSFGTIFSELVQNILNWYKIF